MVEPAHRTPRSEGGARWWSYERPERVTMLRRNEVAVPLSAPTDASSARPDPERLPGEWSDAPAGRAGAFVIAGLLATLVVATRGFGLNGLGVVLIPAAGVVGALAFGQRCRRIHPEEPWLPRLLLLGVAVKLAAAALRYQTLVGGYDGGGDATRYDVFGRRFVAAWVGDVPSAPELPDLRGTNFMKWFTGVVYYLFGQNLLAGFLLFALVAFIGSYMWYRAVATAVPMVDKRLFLLFVMFVPSIVFWPSSLGKDALMHFGLGALAWASALLLTGQFTKAAPLMLGGGWMVWLIRPHLLALVTVATAVPYFLGRIEGSGAGSKKVFGRPLVMAVIAVAVVFTVAAGAKFVGLDSLSVSAIQAQLDEQTAVTTKGGSSYSTGSNSLSPLNLPVGLVTVLFRPFLWEAGSGFGLFAALEATALMGLIAYRIDSLKLVWRRLRLDPYLLFCVVLLILTAMTYSSLGNFGLLTRQRSLVLPALYALIAVDPMLARLNRLRDELPNPVRPTR